MNPKLKSEHRSYVLPGFDPKKDGLGRIEYGPSVGATSSPERKEILVNAIIETEEQCQSVFRALDDAREWLGWWKNPLPKVAYAAPGRATRDTCADPMPVSVSMPLPAAPHLVDAPAIVGDKECVELWVDRDRAGQPPPPLTQPIAVRALDPSGRWVSCWLHELSDASVVRLLRSRGPANPWAESVVLSLLHRRPAPEKGD